MLQSLCKGSVLDQLKSYTNPVTAYKDAVNFLDRKFGNPKEALALQFNAFLALQPLKKPSKAGLLHIVETTERVFRVIEVDIPNTVHWDEFIVHMLELLMDGETTQAWKLKHPAQKYVEKKEICLEFLRIRADSYKDDGAPAESSPKPATPKKSSPHAVTPVMAAAATTFSKCPACPHHHNLWTCPDFKKMDIKGSSKL